MQIRLNEEEITQAIVESLQNRGLSHQGTVCIEFSMTRKPSRVHAEVIFDEELPSAAPANASAASAESSVEDNESSDEDPDFNPFSED